MSVSGVLKSSAGSAPDDMMLYRFIVFVLLFLVLWWKGVLPAAQRQ